MKKLPKIKLSKKPVYKKIAEDLDFYELFQKIEKSYETCFIFESLGEDGKFSRYSIIGFDPERIISARDKNLKIDDEIFSVDNPYESLREMMPEQTITREYAGGLIGYISYEAANYFESSLNLKINDKFDQFMFGVYTDGLIFDKETNELFYFYYDYDRSEKIKKIIDEKLEEKKIAAKFIKNSLDVQKHEEMVGKIKEEIGKGNTFQCVVGMKSEYQINGDVLSVYEDLRKSNPSPFMYYVKFLEKKIIGSSPELLFSLRDGEMVTRPLAGTIKRGKDGMEDKKLARELLSDEKERAEHNMLVDLHRNDIGRVAKFGSVKIRDLMSVKKFSHVQHISSEITGVIKKDEDMFSALASNFPAGTLTGAPKIEAMKIIDRLEAGARGPYGGGIGHFGFNGDCTFAIAIRTLFVSGDYAYTQTSSGIVYDSIAKREYKEIENKLKAIQETIESL